MDIREYKTYGPDVSISLPKGSRFLDARYSLGSLCLYFEVARDYTHMERWQMFLAHQDQNVSSWTGWNVEDYRCVATVLPAEGLPLAFLFHKSES